MSTLLAFSLLLFTAVLISARAERSALSTSVLVLVGGFVTGPHVLGISRFEARSPETTLVAELALFATLFTDGQRVSLASIRDDWRPPARALAIGLPLSVGGVCLLGHWLAGLSWRDGLLLGAVLAPTDPVFASAIVEREHVSERLRRLLNVESGINDGLALPLVLGLLHHYALGAAARDLLLPVLVGIVVGVSVMWLAHRLEASPVFEAHASYRGTAGLALAGIVYALTRMVHGNEFLAAFAAGVTAISFRPELSEAFAAPVAQAATVLKFGGVFVLGGLLAPAHILELRWSELLLVLLSLVAVRPISLVPALWGQGLSRREWIAAAWFGPKGFASVLYAVFVLQARGPEAQHLFVLAALVITTSIVAHSTSEVPVARWLARGEGQHAKGQRGE